MGFSQLLLTAFVIWWLGHQYSNEEQSLKKELSLKFAETERQVADSVIFRKYIKPLTVSSDVHPKKITMRTIDVVAGSKTNVTIDTISRKKSVVAFNFSDSLGKGPWMKDDNHVLIHKKSDEVMEDVVMGIKMFISNAPGDTANIQGEYTLEVEADSGLFKKLFDKKVSDMSLHPDWQKHGENNKGNMFYLSSERFKNMPAVVVTGYNAFLLGRIWQEIGFGVLLVLLTATSFILAYRSIRAQHRLNTIREEFISNISHELKTPLSTAKVTIEALKTFDEKKRAEILHEYLDIADGELTRLDTLVTKVLHNGMLENDNGFVKPEPVNITALVQDVADSFKLRVREQNATIVLEPSPPLVLQADPIHVHGVLANLVDNALKYNNSENPLINISIVINDNRLLIMVKDNGPGINAEYIGKVFDKFFRVPSGNVHNVKGHGLGLSYTYAVMQKHGGKVMVENNPGGGCTFTLIFPYSQA